MAILKKIVLLEQYHDPKSLEVMEAFCGLLKRMVSKFVTVMSLNLYKQNKESESL